jgi:cell division protein ZapA (FtsZ GTPase activity inhibitor)
MSDLSQNLVPVDLEIYGQRFTVRAPTVEHERILAAAEYMNSTIHQLVEAGVSRDTGRLAIQAGLMIAIELFKLRDDIHAEAGLTEEVKSRINKLIEHLDNTLRTL